MRSVGLTGNIASGKSTVARLLRRNGLPVIDADAVARQLVQPGCALLDAICERFGAGVLAADGSLDREALGGIIRADPVARLDLDGLTHPAIYAHIQAWLEAQASLGVGTAVVEAALLVETGQERLYDMLVVVSCSPELQVQRLVADRGMQPDAAQAWLVAQLPAARKEQLADLVIHNNGSREDLEQAVIAALPRILGG